MALPVEVLLGIYLGLLTGIVPALVAGSLGFLVRYFTGVTLPGFGVVVLALSIASVQGGLLGLVEPTIAQSPRLLVAVLVVLMLSLYAHNQGDKLGSELPRRLSFRSLRQRTLSAEVVELVGAMGQVTVRPTGEVGDLQGYPPLPAELRRTLRDGSWRLPADLPLSELETRLAERLRTDHDLADVDVTIDEQARATIAAAPPSGALSRRLEPGRRAISLETLVPTGLARGDEVSLLVGDRSIDGRVLSARGAADEDVVEPPVPLEDEATPEPTPTAPQTGSAGGAGRVTVDVPRRDARAVLQADDPRLVVTSRGHSREFEALAMVRQAGQAIRRVTVGATQPGEPADPSIRVVAIRNDGDTAAERAAGWQFSPSFDASFAPGDEVIVAGPAAALEQFVEAVGR